MSFDSFKIIFKNIVDICVVWALIYFLLKNIKNNIKFTMLFKGIIIIIALKIVSDLLNLTTVGIILEYIIMWGPLALIIIFQPEIRSVLEQLGRSKLLGRHKTLTVSEREKIVYEIGQSLEYFKKHRIGALIVVERDNSLSEYIERSKKIYGDISNELLESIFFPDNPLHDGGVIIQGDKITSAGGIFPTTVEMKFSKRLGTRHRAAIGISEETDAVAIIVSEETGRISIAVGGELNYNLSVEEAKIIILDELRPKKTTSEFDEEEEGDNNENEENL